MIKAFIITSIISVLASILLLVEKAILIHWDNDTSTRGIMQ
jgi:hypothetical protein